MFPFDAEVLASLYALYNAAVWPAPAVALGLALVALWLAVPPRRGDGRFIGTLLAAGWLWCGLVFFDRHLAPFDFMAPVYGWLFVAQAVLLLWGLVWRRATLQFRADVFGAAGLALAAVALFGLPLLAGFVEGGYASARIVGVAPGPTALFTLGLLLLAPLRTAWPLMVIPLLWTGVAGAMAWALDVMAAWPLPFLGLAALLLSLWRLRRAA